MISRVLEGIILGGALGAGMLFASGCASTGSAGDTDAHTHAYAEGMMCPACETVWVTDASTHPPRQISRLISSREMTCPDCDEMARSILLGDGKMKLHECSTCKVTPTPITPAEHVHPQGGRAG